MSLIVREVKTKTDRRKFIDLQFAIYKGNSFWVPPIISDEMHYLDSQQNVLVQHNDAKFFIAERDGKVVGRIGAIINKEYNEKTGKKYIRFSKPEFIDDYEVSQALIDKVIEIGKSQGLELIHGPLGFSNLDTQGLLVEGFDTIASAGSNYHLPYYKEHFERMGFVKENDWLEFMLTLSADVIERGKKAAELVKKRYGYEVPMFKNIKELIPYTNDIFDTINDVFEHLHYVTKFQDFQKDYYMKKYLEILDPKYFKIALKGEDFLGFMIANPSLSQALQKANGRMLPFGYFKFKNTLKHTDTGDFLLVGVNKKYQNSGIAVILFSAIQTALFENNIKYCEITGNFEDNLEAINNWKVFEHVQHKRRRCFVKNLI